MTESMSERQQASVADASAATVVEVDETQAIPPANAVGVSPEAHAKARKRKKRFIGWSVAAVVVAVIAATA